MAASTRAKRERSPSFPFIPLQTAIGRLVAFEAYFKRRPAPAKQSGLAWGMGGWTSQVQQTLAALKAFGLIVYQRSGGNLQVAISDAGRAYLRAQQETAKQEVLRRAALSPKSVAKYFKDWGPDRPPDPVCLKRLIQQDGFTEAAARIFLGVYDASLAYGGIGTSDQPDAAEEEMAGEGDAPPPPTVKVGITSNGPRRASSSSILLVR